MEYAVDTWIDGYDLPPDVEDRTAEIEQDAEAAWDDVEEVYAALEDYNPTTADCEALVKLRLYRDMPLDRWPLQDVKKALGALFNGMDRVMESYVAENWE